jgi:hypothetical protein
MVAGGQQAFTQWMYLDPLQVVSGGAPGGGDKTYPITGEGPEPWFRDRLDAKRSARIPTAEYPSGYLGAGRTRREDRLVQGGGSRMTQKGYQRGIHKGAAIDPSDYYWSEDVHPMAGLEAQAQGRKWAPTGDYLDKKLTNDGKPMPRGAMGLALDPGRDSRIPDRLRPRWK